MLSEANIANLALAPQLIGLLSDGFRRYFDAGSESLRYALTVTAFTGFWAACHYWAAGKDLRRDLAHAIARDGADRVRIHDRRRAGAYAVRTRRSVSLCGLSALSKTRRTQEPKTLDEVHISTGGLIVFGPNDHTTQHNSGADIYLEFSRGAEEILHIDSSTFGSGVETIRPISCATNSDRLTPVPGRQFS